MMLAARRVSASQPALRHPSPVTQSRHSRVCLWRIPRAVRAPARSQRRWLSAGSGDGKKAPIKRPGECEPMTRAEMEQVVQNAKDEERWMNILMPERNWGVTSPVTWVMFGSICVLFVYNNKTAERNEKIAAEKRLEEEKNERIRATLRKCHALSDAVDRMCSKHVLGKHCHDPSCVKAIEAVAQAGDQCKAVAGFPPAGAIAEAMAACGRSS